MKSLVVVLAVLVAAPVFAQAPGQTPPIGSNQVPNGRIPARPGPMAKQDRRERIKQRIRALRAYTLTDELQLDEATAGKLFPMLSHYDDEFDKLLQEHADLQKRLDSAGELKDPRAIDKLIDAAIANQRKFRDVEDQRLGELRKILTPAQTARVLIVLPALERRIQNQLQKAINKPNKGARRRQQLLDDDDDDIEGDEKPAAPRRGPPQKPCDPFDTRHPC
jgi:hypothetical protein